jgi:large subunit ribosomal protein L18e
MKRGTTDKHLRELIIALKKTKKASWKRIAERLERPRRNRAEVNIMKINKHTKEGETVVVPGKVLSEGELDHRVTIAALSFSGAALEKLKGQADCLEISELLSKNPDGSKIRIME